MKKGLTLIEIVVVVAIIGLLATLVVLGFTYPREKSRDTERMALLNKMAVAVGNYYADHQTLPACSADCQAHGMEINPGTGKAYCQEQFDATVQQLLGSNYLESGIKNPAPDDVYTANIFGYCASGTSYDLWFRPEVKENSTCDSTTDPTWCREGSMGDGIYLLKDDKPSSKW